ncbi:MAG: hypothetical protein ACRC2T_14860 [Thermoguttaceae bacterium]
MSTHMIAEVIYETFLVGDTTEGTTLLHPDAWSEKDNYKLMKGECWEEKPGWYVRETAPGYMDSTDWRGPFDMRIEALESLDADMFADESEDIE